MECRHRLRTGLTTVLLSGATILAPCAEAVAQTATAPLPRSETTDSANDPPLETIVVTGSRVRRTSADSPAPLAIVDAEVIRATGLNEIADVINQLPALAITQTNQTSNLLGNAGLNALDLRGLGTERTLVLVDGRRRVPAIPGTAAVDISTVPSNLVQRIEVITGGASALYGADAVAGVANFIRKEDYEGIDTSWRYGGSARGDLHSYSGDILLGSNFADGRGNLTAFAFYQRMPGTVSGVDRPWTARGYPIYSRANRSDPYTVQDGVRSIYDRAGSHVLLGEKLYAFNNDGTLRLAELGPDGFTNASPIDLGRADQVGLLTTGGGQYGGRYDDWLLSVPSDRFSASATVNFAIGDAHTLFASVDFSNSDSISVGAPLKSFGFYRVPADSPFISDAMRAANGGAIAAPLNFAGTFTQTGRSRTEFKRQLVQFAGGAKGVFEGFSIPWDYSLVYSFGRTRQKTRQVNNTAIDRFRLGLDTSTDASGNPVCRSTLSNPGNGCVAINPFAPLTQDMIDYIQYSTQASVSTMSQQVVSGAIRGDLVELPAGPLQFVLGGEYRAEKNDIGAIPELDPDSPSFDSSIGATQARLAGAFHVAEAFAEVSLPILREVPAFHRLTLDAAVRASDYSTAGSTLAYKGGGEWAPIPDLRFRATYGKAVRAPNIGELYTAGSVSGQWVNDPCNDWNLANRPGRTEFTAANCATLSPSNGATFWQFRDIIAEGNRALTVETAKTLTAGVVLQPRFIDNLAISADYYRIDLENAIDALGAQAILNRCVDLPSLDNPFCGLIRRNGDGNLESISTRQINLARFLTRGIDFEAIYSLDLPNLGLRGYAGRLTFNLVYGRILSRDYTLDPSRPGTVTKFAGVFGTPKYKGVSRLTYSAGPFSVTWSARHFGRMKQNASFRKENYQPLYTPHVVYNDVSASWWFRDNTVSLYAGVNNVFDKAPPRLPGAEAGGANFELSFQAGVYDVIGRTVFIGLRFAN